MVLIRQPRHGHDHRDGEDGWKGREDKGEGLGEAETIAEDDGEEECESIGATRVSTIRKISLSC